MKKIVLFAFAVLGLMTLSSSAPSIITMSVEVGTFDSIIAKGKFDVKYLPGDQSVKVCGPENSVKKFKIEVIEGVLTIESPKTSFIKGENLVVYISTPSLASVRIEGAGDFRAERGIVSENLNLNVSGAGNVEVKSLEVDDVKLSINGAGDIEVNGAICNGIDVVVNGAGDVGLEGVECKSFTANMNGAGSVAVAGQALEAHLVLNGAGSIDVSKFSCENLNSKINGIGRIKRK